MAIQKAPHSRSAAADAADDRRHIPEDLCQLHARKFADFNKSAELPTGQTVAVELLPKEPGEFPFACPMGMFRGRLVVE